MANALADATGVRIHSLPLSPDRIFSRLAELSGGPDTP
jgi:CO/xanthine dehydrogenase Mo-binding subunit